jgi:hypothetical protein
VGTDDRSLDAGPQDLRNPTDAKTSLENALAADSADYHAMTCVVPT